MASDMSPEAVAKRLERLRELYVPMTAEEVRERMEPPASTEPFEKGVARRLDELRALLDLTKELHSKRLR